MKKINLRVTLLSILTCAFILILLGLQWQNVERIVRGRANQFDKAVKRSLVMACHDYEFDETNRYLRTVVQSHASEIDSLSSAAKKNARDTSHLVAGRMMFPGKGGDIVFQPETLSHAVPLKMNVQLTQRDDPAFAERVRNACVYESRLLDDVVNMMVYNANETELKKRLKPNILGAKLRESLWRNEIDSTFHYRVVDDEGREVYRCSCYDSTGVENTYQQKIFPLAPQGKGGTILVHFPQRDAYIWSAARSVWPTMAFTFLVFIFFTITIYHLSRQRKGTEMKNDFINNMTHEFKTPLASISLAAQMLNDKSVTKTEKMYENLANIISNESRRMRFQVEKVLQMSLFDHDNIRLKTEELDVNSILESVVNTFQLRISQSGGKVEIKIEAFDPFVYGDEMHLTNVFFNLLDNAVKYAKPDTDLHLFIHTSNDDEHVQIIIEDNGVGIQKKDLSHIFERFYRVHTGNQHNVKGFGLGLAYVYTIIHLHHGKIKAESEYGKGTKFIITLPKVQD